MTHRIARQDVFTPVGVDVGPVNVNVDGVVDKGFDRIGDGLDDEPGGEDENPDPVVRLQPLAEEGDGKQATPDDGRAP